MNTHVVQELKQDPKFKTVKHHTQRMNDIRKEFDKKFLEFDHNLKTDNFTNSLDNTKISNREVIDLNKTREIVNEIKNLRCSEVMSPVSTI